LKPHIGRIREWVDEGKADDWIADALGTSASSVQSFRSRNDIYRRDRHGGGGKGEPANVFEGVLDHGERDGWGLWFDPAVADDPVWREHWSKVDSVVVKLAEDSIVLEIADDSEVAESAGEQSDAGDPGAFSLGAASSEGVANDFSDEALDGRSNGSASVDENVLHMDSGEAQDGVEEDGSENEPEALGDRERGRVKWFDPEKGYGFLIRPTGEDLFVHHSEIEGDAAELGLGGDVEYAVGRNDRGPNARSVRLLPA
jgi:cold shock CspA family protein